MRRLEGRVSIITGSSSGFGRAIAVKFAAEGSKIICADIERHPSMDGFEEDTTTPTHEMIRHMGGEAVFVSCDVTSSSQVKRLVKTAADTYGELNIFVNNAGVARGGKLFHEFAEEDFDVCYRVNVKGTFLCSQEAVKRFLSQGKGGNIINVVSTAGLGGYPYQAVYNISKAAAANLTNSLAIEYGKDSIRVNGICPTYSKTGMSRPLYNNADSMKAIEESIPLGRWGEAKDVADLAVFLASNESAFIHGALIPLDGGERLSRYSV